MNNNNNTKGIHADHQPDTTLMYINMFFILYYPILPVLIHPVRFTLLNMDGVGGGVEDTCMLLLVYFVLPDIFVHHV